MTELPISHSQSANSAGNVATATARLSALFRAALGAGGLAITLHVRRRAMRRTPEAILMAQARRDEAGRAVDRLLR